MSAPTKRRPLYPCALGSAFICFALGVASEGPGAGIALALLGALFGLYVSGVIRLFPVSPAGYPIVGLLTGPLPLAFIGRNHDDRGGMLLVGMILAAILGLLEWSVEAARRAQANPPVEPRTPQE